MVDYEGSDRSNRPEMSRPDRLFDQRHVFGNDRGLASFLPPDFSLLNRQHFSPNHYFFFLYSRISPK